ncbi:hypothetical protein [Streptomyces pinistramenti]|uniref:hypothetical protein n=1 Tax=Streptomyces pinistramenti TaxID=2884812 RepID=UPI001D0602C0|nr:hypothetical protein [Streptomyces pinistramenti]MCB5910371.1 hypothetical protein [Streptomyces pinistramenti]
MSNNWGEETSWESAGSSGTKAAANRLSRGSRTTEQEREAAVESAVKDAVEEARPGLHKIPDPVEPAGEGPLSPEEKERFQLCNEGIDLGNTAWFIQGKALDTTATGRLFRETPHKLEPERCYRTIEEWAPLEKGISLGQCSKLRAGWAIGEVLAARGYITNPGQVREIVPVRNAFNLNAAVAVYVLVADAAGADKVTAERLRDTVKMLPGDLELDTEEDVDVLAKTIKGVLVEETQPSASRAIPPAVTRAVEKRSVALADALNRPRIPRSEVQLHLMQAFADLDDPTVYEAVLKRMQAAEKAAKRRK